MRSTKMCAIAAAMLAVLTGCSIMPIETDKEIHTVTEDEVYASLEKTLGEFGDTMKFKGDLDMDTVQAAIGRIRDEHPEFFWIDMYTLSSSTTSAELEISAIDDLSSKELSEMYSDMETMADLVISGMPKGLDDYGKLLYVHDYIVLNTDYDNGGADASGNGLWGTAYGCLVDGKAVCQGYAEAFQLIVNKLGIKCGVCVGESDRGPHAWNYVELKGKYYWVDTTWDDPDFGSGHGSGLVHSYFLVDDEHLLRSRKIGDENRFTPRCRSMDMSYFAHNNAYLAYYSEDDISRILNDNVKNGSAEIMFVNYTVYSTAKMQLFTNDRIWELMDDPDSLSSISYSEDDTMCTIMIHY